MQVGRLVLMAFVGMPKDGEECCHNNGIAHDNRLENLRWDTHLENNRDRLRHGTYGLGEDHHAAKLTSDKVLEIYHSNLPVRVISQKLKVSENAVSRIRNGKAWASVTGGKPVKTIYMKRKTDRLDSKKASDILELYHEGMGVSEIANLYGVNPTTIRHVIAGKTWNNGRLIVDCSHGVNHD